MILKLLLVSQPNVQLHLTRTQIPMVGEVLSLSVVFIINTGQVPPNSSGPCLQLLMQENVLN